MMTGSFFLVDTNILLRWAKPDDRDHLLVRTAIDGLLRRETVLCYTSQNLAEFWNVCTRPVEKNGYGLGVGETDKRASVIERNLQLLPDSLAVHREWRKIVVEDAVSGVQVHDAKLVAAMRIHGVTRVLTFNQRDFVRYSGIEALHPQTLG
jgi:predicted nucleic acid-binding protein